MIFSFWLAKYNFFLLVFLQLEKNNLQGPNEKNPYK